MIRDILDRDARPENRAESPARGDRRAPRTSGRERRARRRRTARDTGRLAARAGRPDETLCPAGLGQVAQAGRGVARWGRHRLAADSVEALRVIGAFGVADAADAARLFETAARARRSLAELRRRKLLRLERFRRGGERLETVSLTQSGKRLLERSVDPRESGDEDAQRYRAGPARSAQVQHDVAVFRAARLEMKSIEAAGGSVTRVLTDDDLRRLAWRLAERARRAGQGEQEAKAAAAASLELRLCDGKLTLPDARIEYRAPGGLRDGSDTRFLDLEITTPDYRDAAMRDKAAAGFRMYSIDADGRLDAGSARSEAAL